MNSRILEYILRIKDEASKEMEKFAKSTQKSFENAEAGSKMFLGGLTAVTGALGVAVKMAGDMEMLRSSLDTLTGSAEKGAQLFQELNKFAATTPFAQKDLAKATETMLGFGISQEKVMGNLKMLGDISLGNSTKLNGLALAFSQVQSTGKLMGQDLLQMINQGFNPLTIISEKTGKSMAVLKDEMAAGAISADMVTEAMKIATSEGGLFFGGMERGAKTMNGVFSTLMDTVNMTAREMVGLSETGEVIEGGLVDTVKTAILDLTTFLETNKETVVQFFEQSLGWIKENGPIVAGIILGGLAPAFHGLAGGIIAAMTPLIPFIAIGAALGFAAQILITHLGGWEEAQRKLSDAYQQFVAFYNEHIQPVLDVLTVMFNEHIKPAIDDVRKTVEDELIPQLKDLWKTVREELLPALKDLWEIISPVLIPVLKLFAAIIGSSVIEGLKGLIKWLGDTINNVNTAIKAFSRLIEIIRGIPAAVTDAMNKAKDLLDKLNPFHRESPSLVDNVLSGVKMIKKEYESLASMSLPSINSQLSPSLAYSGAQQGTTQQYSYSSPITVNATINNDLDAYQLAHILGFELEMRSRS